MGQVLLQDHGGLPGILRSTLLILGQLLHFLEEGVTARLVLPLRRDTGHLHVPLGRSAPCSPEPHCQGGNNHRSPGRGGCRRPAGAGGTGG